MDPSSYLSDTESKARYLLHNNYKEDDRYIGFLSELANPCINLIPRGSICIDYGCGHTKVMEHIFKEKGFTMDSYDPLFYPDIKRKSYDLVTCNEVIEHFYDPMCDFTRIYDLLNKGGILGLGVSLFNPGTGLESWYYMKDPTHVSFYSFKTFAYIVQKFKLEILDTPSDRVIILRKL
jgi:SAM-dependent methyltransferase